MLASYTYDRNGNLATITNNQNGMVSSINRNHANMIISRTNVRNGVELSRFTYQYFSDGNISGITEMILNDGVVNNRNISFDYGRSGRLIRETDSFSGNTTNFTYDNFGNRTSRTVTGTNPSMTLYDFDENNRLLSTHTTAENITDISQFHYDPNGNMIFRLESQIAPGIGGQALGIGLLGENGHANMWEFEFDGFNRLTGVETYGMIAYKIGF